MREVSENQRDSRRLREALAVVFGPVDDSAFAEVASSARWVEAHGGSVVYRQGDAGDSPGASQVSEGAQRTDAYQANRNLLLSDGARADSIPGLEILANDVRCTHGATIGHVDAEQMHYLMARGVPSEVAQRLIVEGFFAPVLDRIPLESVRKQLQGAIGRKIG